MTRRRPRSERMWLIATLGIVGLVVRIALSLWLSPDPRRTVETKFTCPGDSALSALVAGPGGRIIWTSEDTGPCDGVYLTYPDGLGIRPVARRAIGQAFTARGPKWSPDGDLIAFMGQCGAESRIDLCVMSADGTGRRTVAAGPLSYDAPTWSPDGTRLAFGRFAGRYTSIRVIGIDGNGETTLVDRGTNPAWSPDGTRIAYASDHGGTNRIFLVNPDGSGQVRLTDGPDDSDPAWSPDGSRIAFTSGQAGKPGFSPPGTARRNTNPRPRPAHDIYVMRADGTGAARLTDDPSDNLTPAWSPDGGRIAFSSVRDGDYELYVMDADGTDVRRLTHVAGRASDPSWTA